MENNRNLKDIFNETKEYIIKDISNCIRSDANFLCILGLMIHTEFIGGLMRIVEDNDSEKVVFSKGESKKNFNKCFKKISQDYDKSKLNENDIDVVYDTIRSGLVHRASIKKEAIVRLNKSDPDGKEKYCDQGIYKDDNGKLVININQYFKEFKKVLEDFEIELNNNPKNFTISTSILPQNIKAHIYTKTLNEEFSVQDFQPEIVKKSKNDENDKSETN